MITEFKIIWTIISVLILLLTIRLGVRYHKDIYRIVGWNLLLYLAVSIVFQFIASKIQLSNLAQTEYDKIKVGETVTVKGLLDFHIMDLTSGDSVIFIIPPDSMVDDKIIRSDSTHFTIRVLTKSGRDWTVMHIYSDKTQVRKFKDIDISELMKDSKQLEITFLGKKIEDHQWDCINIISIDKINSKGFHLANY